MAGIKTLPDAYTVGSMSINVVLCAFNCSKDIYISMLSDDEIQEVIIPFLLRKKCNNIFNLLCNFIMIFLF